MASFFYVSRPLIQRVRFFTAPQLGSKRNVSQRSQSAPICPFAILRYTESVFGNPFMNSNLRWTIVGSSTCIVVLLLLGARSGGAVAHDDVYGHLKVYTEVLERIKLEYVEEPDMKSVTLGAINGLL